MRTSVSLNPFADLRRLAEMVDRTVTDQFENVRGALGQSVPMDIFEEGNCIKIRASVPGVRPEDMRLSIEDNVLTLSGELKEDEGSQNRRFYHREHTYGRFARSVRLPEDVNEEGIDAEFSNGMIYITAPRRQATEQRPRQVTIRHGSTTGGAQSQPAVIDASTTGSPSYSAQSSGSQSSGSYQASGSQSSGSQSSGGIGISAGLDETGSTLQIEAGSGQSSSSGGHEIPIETK
jgi:HSP20 family protein